MHSSGVLDKNGIDICAGDTVEFVINIAHQKPVISHKEIVYYKGAFRFKDVREWCQSCIGDISHNCTLEVLKE